MTHVLLIEDDDAIRSGLQTYLEQHGYAVTTWRDIKPVESLHNTIPDMILLDVALPSGDGFSFCKELRRFSGVPVIFLTVFDDEESVVRGLSCGGDDYIAKPFSARVLVSRMEALLRRASSRQTQCMKSGDLLFFAQEHRVLLRGESLDLLPREWKILETFLRNPGRLLTRQMLLEQIWDAEGSFVDNNTLSVNVSRLRKKLGDFRKTPYIRTERGFGYRWEVPCEKG